MARKRYRHIQVFSIAELQCEQEWPQTRLHVHERGGVTVRVERIRKDSPMKGIKYIALRHNLVRGGAGCSILNAELLSAQKYIQ